MRMKTLMAVAVVLACSSLGLAQDQLTTQAVKRLDRVQGALDQGAKPADAQGLLSDLAWAAKRLNGVYKQDEPHHQAAVKRLKELEARVQALGAGGKPPAESGKGVDVAKLKSLERDITNAYGNLQILNKSYMGDASRVNPIKRDIANFRERLSDFPKEDASVQSVAKTLDAHEGLFKKWLSEYEADQAGSVGVPERLEALNQKYVGDHRPILPAEPFDPAFIDTWSADVGQWLLSHIPKDMAYLDSLTGNAAVDSNAVARLKNYVGMSWRDRLTDMAKELTQMIESQLSDAIEFGEFLKATDPKDPDQVANRILGEGALERATERLEKGRAALGMARSLDTNLARAPQSNRDQQGKALDDAVRHLKDLSLAALEGVRMPKAKNEDAELKAAALAVLKASGITEKSILRMVVVTDKVRREKKEGTITPGTVQARVDLYHYIWEEYQVATAEQVGAEVWIHYTTLKKYEGGGSKTPLNRWIMAGRFKSTPIKPEHVHR